MESRLDGFAKSRKTVSYVILAKAGIQIFRAHLHNVWTPIFTGVTTFYDSIKI